MEKNSCFYVDQFNTLQESAKNACIELLKENPAGRYIDLSDEEDFSDAIWVMTGNAEAICIDAIGLNEKNELVFKGQFEDGYFYNDHDWTTFDEFTQYYHEIYKFIVDFKHLATVEPRQEEDEEED